MLYALWCLQDVERVDAIEDRMIRAREKTMLPFTDGGVRNLNEELAAVQRELRTPATRTQGGLPRDQMLSFPGMPNYKGSGNVS